MASPVVSANAKKLQEEEIEVSPLARSVLVSLVCWLIELLVDLCSAS